MAKINLTSVALAAIVFSALLFASGCNDDSGEEIVRDESRTFSAQIAAESIEIDISDFSSDKEEYKSHEEIKLSVSVQSSEKAENIAVRVWGIRPRSYSYIDSTKAVSLEKGNNEILFDEKAPPCTSGCGGVNPGPYDIHAEILADGEIVSDSKITIDLARG